MELLVPIGIMAVALLWVVVFLCLPVRKGR